MPLRARPRAKLAEVASESWPELEHPASNRLIRDVEPALGQEFLYVAVAQGEPKIEPDGVPAPFRRARLT